MEKIKLRREKLGDFFFDLAKYTTIALVIGKFLEPKIAIQTFCWD